MKKTKIHKFGGLPNSEDQKRTKIRSVGFRVLKNNEKSRFVSGVSGGIPKNRIPKDSFLSVLGRWIYRFGLRFLGVEYTVSAFGYWTLNILYVSTFGSWTLDMWVSTFGSWALDIWVLTFGWALDIWVSFHFGFLVGLLSDSSEL
ncbi:unnamed protein product [Rhizophagus irregularis]|nr:unnamed protein product [Rhizophagus irregularis]